jgi:Uma2 family endonuclease
LGLLPESTELLHGQIIQKMSKSPLHTYLQQFLADLLRPLLPAGLYLRVEQPITCSDSELESDLALVRGRSEDYRREHPRTAELLIEICVSSHDFDRSKLRAYASASVKECWLVLAPKRQIEVYRQPAGQRYELRSVHKSGQRLTSSAVPQITVDLAALFAP